jgi:hypothetical protein
MTFAPRLLTALAALGLAATAAWATPGHTPAVSHPTATTKVGEVWNWAQIDTNQDHLIEPAEMEKFLAEHPGPLKKAG